jgi:excisionase family DNA binding protein
MTTERSGSHLSRLLTVQEVAELLQIPAKTIYTWRYKRIGPPAVPMGKYLRFRVEDVAAWLEEHADVPQ